MTLAGSPDCAPLAHLKESGLRGLDKGIVVGLLPLVNTRVLFLVHLKETFSHLKKT